MEFSLIYRSRVIIRAYDGWLLPSDKVLDIGCGNGVVTEEIKKHFSCNIIGTDILDYRKRNIEFKIMERPNELPFTDSEFDVCMFNDALHHCDDQASLLKESLRVAAKVLIFEMEPTLTAKIVEVLVNQIHNPKMNIPFNIKTREQWCAQFKEMNLGFEYRMVNKPSFFYPFINFAFRLKR